MRLIVIFNIFLVAPLCFSCKQTSENDVSGVGVKATVFSSTKVQVCWENRSQADLDFKDFRSEFRQYVQTEFDRTVVRLNGWTDCENPEPSKNEIRITWWEEAEAPETYVMGASAIGNGRIYAPRARLISSLPQMVKSAVRPAPTLALNSGAFKTMASTVSRKLALANFKNTLLHEFGHAVGLLHEHVRQDSTCESSENFKAHETYWKQATEGLEAVQKSIIMTDKFDSKSVMNYCFISEMEMTGKTVSLSAGDVQVINKLYSK